ncbi:hypothetical protein [Spirochaeta cellobiosiphila]|uniref:hypothetical protein n=1 Tax=Spirochaeta cellobiosiphila TaxID=504483 RepID=UPI00040CFDA2|nr:hypothetical protein [Spirochaeta cellobiosiphila]
MRKYFLYSIPFILILAIIGVIYSQYFYASYYYSNVIPVDDKHSLVLIEQSWQQRDSQNFLAYNDIDKGIIWKFKVDSLSLMSSSQWMYEKNIRRDVMVKNGQISILLQQEKQELYKFDINTGQLLGQVSLDSPTNEDEIYYWMCLHDGQNIYCRTINAEGEPSLAAIDFDSFQILWYVPLKGGSAPYQNDKWIISHEKSYPHNYLRVISKVEGTSLLIPHSGRGFLKDDYYYYPDFLQNNEIWLSRIDLNNSHKESLIDISDLSIPDTDISMSAVIANYKDNLIYYALHDGVQIIISYNLKDNHWNWFSDLPTGYRIFNNDKSDYWLSSPELTGWPIIQTPFYIIGVENINDQSSYKYIAVNMDSKGSIHWESTYPINRISRTNNFKSPNYYLYIPIAGDSRYDNLSIMAVNGFSGDINSWIRLGRYYKGRPQYLEDVMLTHYYAHRKDNPKVIVLDKDAFYNIDRGKIDGRHKNLFFVEDIKY